MPQVRRALRVAHGAMLLVLFIVGIVLIYESSVWYLVQGNWLGTAALALVGGSSLCLALFGQKNRFEGVVAATIVSAFWTVGAAVAFAKVGASQEAWTLLVSSVAQVAATILGAASVGADQLDDDFLSSRPAMHSHGGATIARNYGALSTFIDPLSSAAAVRPGPSGSQASNISQASQSPAASPHLIARTPSPFATHASPHRMAPASLASLSAAATPRETPEDIKQSYKALWEKYDLDT
jgi:hypothetical protein